MSPQKATIGWFSKAVQPVRKEKTAGSPSQANVYVDILEMFPLKFINCIVLL